MCEGFLVTKPCFCLVVSNKPCSFFTYVGRLSRKRNREMLHPISGGFFILQLHDELLYEVAEDDVIQVELCSCFFLAIYSITMFKRALIEMDLLLMCAKGPAKEMLNWLKNYIYIRDSFTFRLEPSLWLKFITSFPVPVGAVLPVSPQDMSEIA